MTSEPAVSRIRRGARRRLLVSLLALIVVTLVVAVFAYHPIFHLLRQHYCDLPGNRRTGGIGCQLIFTHPTDAFFIRLRSPSSPGSFSRRRSGSASSGASSHPACTGTSGGGPRRSWSRRWSCSCSAAPSPTSSCVRRSTCCSASGRRCHSAPRGDAVPVVHHHHPDHLRRVVRVPAGDRAAQPGWGAVLGPAALVAAYRDLPALLCLPGPDRPRTRSRCWRWLCRCLLFELSVLFARWNDKRRARKDAESEWAGLGDDESSPTPAPGQAPLPEHASSTPSELDDS